jgi:hypothetical protein
LSAVPTTTATASDRLTEGQAKVRASACSTDMIFR